jgi:AAA domain
MTITSGERDYSLSLKEGWFDSVEAPPRPQPPIKSMDELKAMRKSQRARYEEQRAVWHANLGPLRTPQMSALHDDLWEIVEANRQDGDKVKGAAVLDAYPGRGKTTAAVEFGREFHRRQIELYGPTTRNGHQRIPVVYVGLTANTTMWSLNSMLCRYYAHPGAERGNAFQLADRAAECVHSCATRLVIVDDVHFLDPRRRDGKEVANHFKWLANQFPVTFLFVGVEIRERGLLNEGMAPGDAARAQTARRWTPFDLPRFEIRTTEGKQAWRRLLLAIEQRLVLSRKYHGMVATDLANYLFARSSGNFASLMTLIVRGCHRAIRTGEERLTPHLLDRVKTDEAAEVARDALQPALENGVLTARLTAANAN